MFNTEPVLDISDASIEGMLFDSPLLSPLAWSPESASRLMMTASSDARPWIFLAGSSRLRTDRREEKVNRLDFSLGQTTAVRRMGHYPLSTYWLGGEINFKYQPYSSLQCKMYSHWPIFFCFLGISVSDELFLFNPLTNFPLTSLSPGEGKGKSVIPWYPFICFRRDVLVIPDPAKMIGIDVMVITVCGI